MLNGFGEKEPQTQLELKKIGLADGVSVFLYVAGKQRLDAMFSLFNMDASYLARTHYQKELSQLTEQEFGALIDVYGRQIKAYYLVVAYASAHQTRVNPEIINRANPDFKQRIQQDLSQFGVTIGMNRTK